MKTYQATIDYLYQQLPMFQRVGPKALKYNLDNITRLMQACGNPQKDLTCIHIAGTNGKGTVSHIIASVLQEAGYVVGLFTSPHYKDYRERIRLNGIMIPKSYVIKFINSLRHNATIQAINPSFFEIGVAMAFQYFADKQAQICIIETGLGGRLDSTNIITPLLSIITNIGYDHQATLGETLPEIANEKAGIIKEKVPVIIGEYQEEVQQVFTLKAQSLDAEINWASTYLSDHNTLISSDEQSLLNDLLQVKYLQHNLTTSLASLTYLHRNDHISITSTNIINGIKNLYSNTQYMGRWQRLSDSPLIYADAAHNVQGVTQIVQHLKSIQYNRLHIILGMVGDKPLDQVLSLLPTEAKYYFSKADIPRGMPADQLKEVASKYQLNGKTYSSLRKALASAKLSASQNDLILVTGSIFTVAEVV